MLASGCRVYDPALVAATDGGVCVSRLPPARPEIPDGDGPEVMFALRGARFLFDNDEVREVGYDLDGLCTMPPDFASECLPPGGNNPNVDGEGGIDNVFISRLFPLLALTTPELEPNIVAEGELGHWNLIVRIFGWNVEPDDPHVDVHMMQAVFGIAAGDEAEPPPLPAEGDRVPPRWDGRDWFWVRDDAFFMGDPTRPLIRDDNAYIAGNAVVARIPDRLEVIFGTMQFGTIVRFTDCIAVGAITADRSGLETVTVSGRWSVNDLLAQAGNTGFCPGERDYELLAEQVDRVADVRSTPGTGGPGVECDAISIAARFGGTRVRFAGVAPSPSLPTPCLEGADAGVPAVDAGLDGG
jgi:hypothetical protein